MSYHGNMVNSVSKRMVDSTVKWEVIAKAWQGERHSRIRQHRETARREKKRKKKNEKSCAENNGGLLCTSDMVNPIFPCIILLVY